MRFWMFICWSVLNETFKWNEFDSKVLLIDLSIWWGFRDYFNRIDWYLVGSRVKFQIDQKISFLIMNLFINYYWFNFKVIFEISRKSINDRLSYLIIKFTQLKNNAMNWKMSWISFKSCFDRYLIEFSSIKVKSK